MREGSFYRPTVCQASYRTVALMDFLESRPTVCAFDNRTLRQGVPPPFAGAPGSHNKPTVCALSDRTGRTQKGGMPLPAAPGNPLLISAGVLQNGVCLLGGACTQKLTLFQAFSATILRRVVLWILIANISPDLRYRRPVSEQIRRLDSALQGAFL